MSGDSGLDIHVWEHNFPCDRTKSRAHNIGRNQHLIPPLVPSTWESRIPIVSPSQNRSGCRRGHTCWYPQCFERTSAGVVLSRNMEERENLGSNCFANTVIRECSVSLCELRVRDSTAIENRLIVTEHNGLSHRYTKIA